MVADSGVDGAATEYARILLLLLPPVLQTDKQSPYRAPRGSELAIAWAVFVALAYLPNWAPARSIDLVGLTIFWAFFSMTAIILCDQVALLLAHRSLLQEATGSGKAWRAFLCIGALSGLLLDGVAQWLGKLWIYPYWNEPFYAGAFIVGFCAYWIATAESYLVVKAILSRWWGIKSEPLITRNSETAWFRGFGACGLALTAVGIVLLLGDYGVTGGYVFEIRKRLPVQTHFSYFLMTFAGVWLVLEWVQRERGRTSLLQTLLHGQWLPLCALLIASAITSLFWETVNAAHHFWVYTNWPWPQWQIMTIPVTVLLTWPLQYVVFLSLGFLLDHDVW